MKKLFLVAAMMLMASASAHAGSYSFHVDGQNVRITVPRGCASIHCINVNAPGMAGKFGSKDKDDAPTTTTTTTATAPVPAPAPAPAPVQQAIAPVAAPVAPVAAPVAPAPAPVAQTPTPVTTNASTKVVMLAPPDTSASSSTVTAPEPTLQPAPAPAPVPTQVVTVAPTPAPAASTQASNSPIGVWMSEKKEGKIRIEDCGGNLCGYSVDAKTGANGAQVLINMKQSGDKWAGRIRDTRSGSNYDSTIALRGSDKLKVQGCAFGGMFCGGETWTRVE